MTQIIATLDNAADASIVRQVIENIKGVVRTSVKSTENSKERVAKTSTPAWLDQLNQGRALINPANIDLSDDRTQYIMSK